MWRIAWLILVGSVVVLATRFTNEAQPIAPVGEELTPQEQSRAKGAAVVNFLEPLLFAPEDCDLDGDGKVNEADMLAAKDRTPAFMAFRNHVMQQACQSAERQGKILRPGNRPEFDCLAQYVISIHAPKPGQKQRGRYRVLTYWDAHHDCTVGYDVIDEKEFEQIERGEVIYELDRSSATWKRVPEPRRPVIIRLKPARPKATEEG